VGKKRRVLKNPKFAKLRTHSKYAGLVAANKQENEEPDEVVIEKVEQKTQTIEEPKLIEPAKPKFVSKKKAAPKTKTKSRARKTTVKKSTRKKNE